MKNLMSGFLGIMLLISVAFFPFDNVYAQTNSITNQVTLETQLNTLQKELIVLLNKKINMLKTEMLAKLQLNLKSAQLQLIGLLEKRVLMLQGELATVK